MQETDIIELILAHLYKNKEYFIDIVKLSDDLGNIINDKYPELELIIKPLSIDLYLYYLDNIGLIERPIDMDNHLIIMDEDKMNNIINKSDDEINEVVTLLVKDYIINKNKVLKKTTNYI